VTRWTAYQYGRVVSRFQAWRVGHASQPPSQPLEVAIKAWPSTLTPHMAHTAYLGLKHHFGDEVRWSSLRKPHARRNDAACQASLFSAPERERIRATVQGPREWCLVELLWVLRREETAVARWAQVDLGRSMLYVPKGKGDKAGWTLLPEPAPLAILAWFWASQEPPDDAFIFPNGLGGHMHPSSINRLMQQILRCAGLYHRGRSCHAFRRTFATAYLKENPSDLAGLQKLLRHESINTTAQYLYLQPEDLARRLARVRF
jgi:integrase